MTRATRVQFAYDDRYLYVAVTCVDDSGGVVAIGLGRRDEQPPTDMVTIAFDPRHDHQTGSAFQTNPSGWQGDFRQPERPRLQLGVGGSNDDYSNRVDRGVSNSVLTSAIHGLIRAGQIWGVNVQRQIRRLNENGTWVSKPRGQRSEVSLYGHLVFEQPIAPPRRLELTPYVAARTTHQPNLSQDSGASTGIDMRLANGYFEGGQPDPWKKFRRFWGWGSYSQGWTDEGLRIDRSFETGVSFQLLNYWNFNGGTGRNGDAFDDLDTRGGPPIFKPGNSFVFFNANSDSRKSWRLNFGGNRWGRRWRFGR